MLQELHRAGLLDDVELAAKRAALDERRYGRRAARGERPRPRGNVRTASAPAVRRARYRSRPRSALVGAVDDAPRASPRRCGRGWPRPGAVETTTAAPRPSRTSNSCRSPTAAWWTWPPTISSAPASTSAASTWSRRATGFFRDRHGAPMSWWWSTATRSAPGAASRSRSRARVELRGARRRRTGGATAAPSSARRRAAVARRAPARSSPTAARTPASAREAGRERDGMSWFPGTASSGGPSAAQERGRLLVLGAPAAVREVAARDDEPGLDPPDERGERALEHSGRPARRSGGRTRGGCA